MARMWAGGARWHSGAHEGEAHAGGKVRATQGAAWGPAEFEG